MRPGEFADVKILRHVLAQFVVEKIEFMAVDRGFFRGVAGVSEWSNAGQVGKHLGTRKQPFSGDEEIDQTAGVVEATGVQIHAQIDFGVTAQRVHSGAESVKRRDVVVTIAILVMAPVVVVLLQAVKAELDEVLSVTIKLI